MSRQPEAISFARFFQGPEHQPFLLAGGRPAALLVHGFPGTPAETRPLAEALNAAGWTVSGLLLPGFGSDIDTLADRRHEEWLEAVSAELRRLRSQHHPILLGGFSMGAALALAAAAIEPPDGLALLAPFWKLQGPIWSLLPLIRRLVPTFKPFRFIKIDLSDPRVRQGMAEFMPGVDLDDPAVQRGIRDFAVPVAMIDELRRAGKTAWQAADRAAMPKLVVQGRQDELVRAEQTARLLKRLPEPLLYQEVEAAHDLLDPERPAWTAIRETVLRFARELASPAAVALTPALSQGERAGVRASRSAARGVHP